MSKQVKVTFGKFSSTEFRSDDREMDIFVDGVIAGELTKEMQCVYTSTMSSYDRWCVGAYTVTLWDVRGQDCLTKRFELHYDRQGNLRSYSITWREALKAAKDWARKQLKKAAEEPAAPEAAAEAAEEQAAPEAARYEFSISQQGKANDDLRLVVKRDGVTIGVIYEDGDQYQLVLLRSRATFDSSVIKAYRAEDCDDFGSVELRSPAIGWLKRFAVEAVQGFAKPVTTTVIDGDRVYLVRRVSPGNEYGCGLRKHPPLVAQELLIEFYLKESPRYSWQQIEQIHGPMGCFVSRYQWSTLADPQYESEILDLGMGCEISRQSVHEALHTLRQLTISAQ